jgi:hypothetical protein
MVGGRFDPSGDGAGKASIHADRNARAIMPMAAAAVRRIRVSAGRLEYRSLASRMRAIREQSAQR